MGNSHSQLNTAGLSAELTSAATFRHVFVDVGGEVPRCIENHLHPLVHKNLDSRICVHVNDSTSYKIDFSRALLNRFCRPTFIFRGFLLNQAAKALSNAKDRQSQPQHIQIGWAVRSRVFRIEVQFIGGSMQVTRILKSWRCVSLSLTLLVALSLAISSAA
jgi:hypothetical protein